MAGNVNIKVTADVSQAQQQLKLVDQQAKGIGEGGIGLDTQAKTISEAIKPMADAQEKFLSSFNKTIKEFSTSTLGITKTLDSLARRLEGLNDKQKQTTSPSSTPSGGSSGGSTPPATGGGGGIGGTGGSGFHNQPLPNPDGSGIFGRLGELGKKLAAGITIQQAVGGVYNKFDSMASGAFQREKQAFNTYNKTGMFGSDFNAARGYAGEIGSRTGYMSSDVMSLQNQRIGQTGYTTQENLTADTEATLRVAKAYGMNQSEISRVAGNFQNQGIIKSGETNKFVNLLASSLKEAGMEGRNDEQLRVLDSIDGNLSKNLVNVNEAQMTNALGLYTELAKGNSSLKGEKGADMVSTMNSSIANGGDKMDILLGWGTKYTGAKGRWELEKAKAKGISDPENLKNIFENFHKLTGFNVDSEEGMLAMQEQFKLNPEQVEELVKNKDKILSGTYSSDLSKAVNDSKGTSDVQEKEKSWLDSKVSTMEKYEVNKQNALDEIGNNLNDIKAKVEAIYNNMSKEGQMMVSGGQAVGSGIMGSEFLQTFAAMSGVELAKKGLGAMKKGSAGGIGKTVAEGAGKAFEGLKGGLKGFAEGSGKAVSKVLGLNKGLGALGKSIGGVASVITAALGGIYAYSEYKKGNDRTATKTAGGALGGLAGGLAGAKAGAAAGGAIGVAFGGVGAAPGAAIGGLLGGTLGVIGGTFGGDWLGGKAADFMGWENKADKEGTVETNAVGTDWVDRDDQPALLHKGEAVLTKEENKKYRESGKSANPLRSDADSKQELIQYQEKLLINQRQKVDEVNNSKQTENLKDFDRVYTNGNKKFEKLIQELEKVTKNIGGRGSSRSGRVDNKVTRVNKNDPVQKQMWDFYKQKGLDDDAISAIMGNVSQESGFNPTNTNGTTGAYGLFQFTNGRKQALMDYASRQGMDYTTPEAQLNYQWWESHGGDSYETSQYQKFENAQGLENKTMAWRRSVERCGEDEANDSNRLDEARKAQSAFGKGSYAVGQPRVPEDGMYQLHKDEAVLPKDEAKQYRQYHSNNKSWLDAWGNVMSDTITGNYKQFLNTVDNINSYEDAQKSIAGISGISSYNQLSKNDDLTVLRAKVKTIKGSHKSVSTASTSDPVLDESDIAVGDGASALSKPAPILDESDFAVNKGVFAGDEPAPAAPTLNNPASIWGNSEKKQGDKPYTRSDFFDKIIKMASGGGFAGGIKQTTDTAPAPTLSKPAPILGKSAMAINPEKKQDGKPYTRSNFFDKIINAVKGVGGGFAGSIQQEAPKPAETPVKQTIGTTNDTALNRAVSSSAIPQSVGTPNGFSVSSNGAGGFKGTINVVVSGNVDGLTEENRGQIVQSILRQIQSARGNRAIQMLSNAMERVPQ